MDAIEKALDEVTSGRLDEAFIQCVDEKHQENTRVAVYSRRKKFPAFLTRDITVTKLTGENGELLVKIYKREDGKFLVRDEKTGKLVEYQPAPDPLNDKDLQRMIQLMEADGKSQDEIDEAVKNWK